jgi:hypothetical protein
MDYDRRASAQRNIERDEVQETGTHDGLLPHSEKRPMTCHLKDEQKPGQGILPRKTLARAIQRTKAR